MALSLNVLVVVKVSMCHSRANSAHIRQSRPESGLGFQVSVVETFQVVPSSLGGGARRFRGGLVFKALRLLYHSTLGSRVIKKKKERGDAPYFVGLDDDR